VLDHLQRHAHIVADLLVAEPGGTPQQNPGAAQPMDRRVLGVLQVDVPLVLFDLTSDPILPEPA
jgi:hypothetical protein